MSGHGPLLCAALGARQLINFTAFSAAKNTHTHTHTHQQQPQQQTHRHTHTHTHAHTHTHTHAHTHFIPPSIIPLSYSLPLLFHSLHPPLSLSHTNTHTHTHMAHGLHVSPRLR